jgi:hypothetical protein
MQFSSGFPCFSGAFGLGANRYAKWKLRSAFYSFSVEMTRKQGSLFFLSCVHKDPALWQDDTRFLF